MKDLHLSHAMTGRKGLKGAPGADRIRTVRRVHVGAVMGPGKGAVGPNDGRLGDQSAIPWLGCKLFMMRVGPWAPRPGNSGTSDTSGSGSAAGHLAAVTTRCRRAGR
jgi:hypothetical protein